MYAVREVGLAMTVLDSGEIWDLKRRRERKKNNHGVVVGNNELALSHNGPMRRMIV
jgi:hypothetical protein